MEKTNLKIEDYEDKKSKEGVRYTRFKTDRGWMSAFEKDIINNLKENEGKIVCVEISEKNDRGFQNIRRFIGKAKSNIEMQHTTEKIIPAKVAHDEKHTTMYVSYAKDIWCAVVAAKIEKGVENIDGTEIMEKAIKMIKQAKSAFK